MRTTLDLDDHLVRTAKKVAAERGIPLRRVVEEALSLSFQRARRPARRKRLRWKVTAGPLLPGVDLTDRDRLYDLMDERG